VIHDIEGFTGLTAKPLACGIQPAYNGMASAVISVFPQHLYRALHFPLDKWALHNGRFFCLLIEIDLFNSHRLQAGI